MKVGDTRGCEERGDEGEANDGKTGGDDDDGLEAVGGHAARSVHADVESRSTRDCRCTCVSRRAREEGGRRRTNETLSYIAHHALDA